MEGRAANLDLIQIYTDPFVLYAYASSILFFAALYYAFRLLGYFAQNEAFSQSSFKALQRIKRCAIALSILIVTAGLFILLTHDKEEDAAGFLALCLITTLISLAVAAATTVFENILQTKKDMLITPDES